MDIVDKTRTRVMCAIMVAMGGTSRHDFGNDTGLDLAANDTLEEVLRWSDKEGVWAVTISIGVNVTKTLIEPSGESL